MPRVEDSYSAKANELDREINFSFDYIYLMGRMFLETFLAKQATKLTSKERATILSALDIVKKKYVS